MNPDLSIVIVSFNTRDLLGGCLRSVFGSLAGPASAVLEAEVWVVDNASSDGSAAMVASEFPGVRLIANDRNRGFAAANNIALARSAGRYVLLLNPDTVVPRDAFAELVAFMDETPAAGAAGVTLLNPDGTLQHSCFRFPTLLMSFFDFFPINHRLLNSRWNGRYSPSQYGGAPFLIDHPLGACFIVRRTAAEQVGWLDASFFIYCEEIDWCLRLKRAGWKVYCLPQVKVVHYGGQSTRQFGGPMLVELHRARQQLFRKHYSPFYQWAAKQIVRLGICRDRWRARTAARRGEITERELSERLAAYGRISRL